jgi:hypothetical protein
MAVTIDLSGVVGAVPTVCTQLRVTLPGGLAVQGSAPYLGASPLEASRATISAVTSALAPLGPVFAILDALLAVVKFAQTVPKVVTRPDKVVAAVLDVVKKSGALASLVPQLSVPLMILGVIDVVIAHLAGLRDEVTALSALATRADEVAALAETVPSLGPISVEVQSQITSRRAQIECGMGDVQPLLGTISALAELIGLPPITVSGDATTGTLDDLATMLDDLVEALTNLRATIPVP